MSAVKWIKITTNMFDDEKIDYIESLPEADSILIVWIKLLTQAGKTNANGFVFLTENIPYTADSLAHKFRRPLNTVKLALETLKRLEMIEFDSNGFLRIANWEKHQNVEGLEKIREQNRLRQSRYRAKQKKLEMAANVNKKGVTLPVTLRNGTELDIDRELDIDSNKDIVEKDKPSRPQIPLIHKEVVGYLNKRAGRQYRHTTPKTQNLIKARQSEGFVVDDFMKVIDIKVAEWKDDPDMDKYLRPETLFGTKFESYLNQKKVIAKKRAGDFELSAESEATLDEYQKEAKIMEHMTMKEKTEYLLSKQKDKKDE